MNKRRLPFLGSLLILITLAACGRGAQQLSAIEMTLTPLSARIVGTATARAGNAGEAQSLLETAVINATARSQEIYATQTARASLNDASKLATATVIAPAIAELPFLGLDPSQGYVAWVQGPVNVQLDGPNTVGFANDFQLVTAKDFAMSGDITWDTKNSLSGCGFMFRSNGDQKKPTQYMVVISRAGNGQIGFLSTVDGNLNNFQVIYPRSKDQTFVPDNGGKNRLSVVARGPLIDIYTNGTLQASIDTTKPPPPLTLPSKPILPPNATPPQLDAFKSQMNDYQQIVDSTTAQLGAAMANFGKGGPILDEGLLGFVGLNKSGHMNCTFDKAWLFQIQK